MLPISITDVDCEVPTPLLPPVVYKFLFSFTEREVVLAPDSHSKSHPIIVCYETQAIMTYNDNDTGAVAKS